MPKTTDLFARYARMFDMPECGWSGNAKNVHEDLLKIAALPEYHEATLSHLRDYRDWLRERLVEAGCDIFILDHRDSDCKAICTVINNRNGDTLAESKDYDDAVLTAAEARWGRGKADA